MGSTTKRGYWFPAGNDAVSLFPGQNELLFMKKLDTDMDTALTANIAAARIPNLPASKITSGTFADARIPDSIARTATTSALEDRIKELETPRSTGPRSLVNDLEVNDVKGGSLNVMRVESTVTVAFDDLEFIDGDGAYTLLIRLPVGFRPALDLREYLISAEDNPGMAMYETGTIYVHKNKKYKYRKTITFVTANDWPTSLPGEPV